MARCAIRHRTRQRVIITPSGSHLCSTVREDRFDKHEATFLINVASRGFGWAEKCPGKFLILGQDQVLPTNNEQHFIYWSSFRPTLPKNPVRLVRSPPLRGVISVNSPILVVTWFGSTVISSR